MHFLRGPESVKSCIFERFADVKKSVFREDFAKNGAKIFDLRDFFENTRYCGECCIKIAYMVKYGRTHKGDAMPVF